MPIKLHRTITGLWWDRSIVGSMDVAVEVAPGYAVAFRANRKGLAVEAKGKPTLTVDEAIKRGIVRILDDAPAP